MKLRPRNRVSQSTNQSFVYKKKGKSIPQTQDASQRESIVLMSSKAIKRFMIYTDEEIGVSSKYSAKIHSTSCDEDYESQDDIVDCGINKCLKFLEKRVKQLSKEKTQTESETESKSVSSTSKATKCKSEYWCQAKQMIV